MQLPQAQLTLTSPMELHLPGRPQVESGLVLLPTHLSLHAWQAPTETGVTA